MKVLIMALLFFLLAEPTKAQNSDTAAFADVSKQDKEIADGCLADYSLQYRVPIGARTYCYRLFGSEKTVVIIIQGKPKGCFGYEHFMYFVNMNSCSVTPPAKDRQPRN
jgi:hypothetical protein